MKILISDYRDSMMPYHDVEIDTLKAGLGEDVEIEVYDYTDGAREEFYGRLARADAFLTAFVQVDKEALDHAPNLKVISINATGFDNVDMDEATRRGIGVCPIGEYCTWDVSEMAIAYMCALNKHFKFYIADVERHYRWDYAGAPSVPRLQDQTLGIVGFGKIGRCTAGKAKGLVKRVIANDPFIDRGLFAEHGVEPVEVDDLLAEADIIVNHMNLNETNYDYFNEEKFSKMKKRPIVINLGRGLCVDEPSLIQALDSGAVRAFGADVLRDEDPDLANHPLVDRDNVIITPHAAFYSTTSLEDMMRISTQNIVHFLKGEKDRIYKLVNEVPVVDVR